MHLALAGAAGATPPDEWLLSRICEEFHCTPLAAIEQPLSLALDIIELRAYARAKAALDAAQNEMDVPRSAAVEWVWEVQAEILKRRNAERAGHGNV